MKDQLSQWADSGVLGLVLYVAVWVLNRLSRRS